MSRIRIIPILLLKKGGLYKTVKFKNERYIGDPVNTVKIFNEKGVDELVVLGFDITAGGKKIDFKKLAEIAGEAFMPMSYGGGIVDFDDAKKIFDAGYEKVIINSTLFNSTKLISKIASVYGSQAVVGAIDIKKNIFSKYKVFSCSGTKVSHELPVNWAQKLEAEGAGEILLNSIDRDGTWQGYDEVLISSIAHKISIPLIACGGAGNINDFEAAVHAGASAVAAGSIFVYQKKGKGVLISFPSSYKLSK